MLAEEHPDARRCRIVDLSGGEARLALAVRCIDRPAEIHGLGDGDATFTHIRETLPRIGRAKRDAGDALARTQKRLEGRPRLRALGQ